MKAITLWQPWASLWVSPSKEHETRHWPTAHRGWLLVHAAKRKLDDFGGDALDDIMDVHYGHHWGLEIPFGAIIGAVHLVDCIPTDQMAAGHERTDDYECGDFTAGRFAWRRDKWRLFEVPIPYRGAQGFFEVPTSLIEDQFGLAAVRAVGSEASANPPA